MLSRTYVTRRSVTKAVDKRPLDDVVGGNSVLYQADRLIKSSFFTDVHQLWANF